MGIMILCSAATCTVSGDDDDRFDNYDNEEQLAATSWKAVYFSDGYEWLDTEDYGCDFTITFFQNEYQATFTERIYDGRVSTRAHKVSDTLQHIFYASVHIGPGPTCTQRLCPTIRLEQHSHVGTASVPTWEHRSPSVGLKRSP